MIRTFCICASSTILTGTFIGTMALAFAAGVVGEYQIAIRSGILCGVSILAFAGICSIDGD